ncbi:MAG: serine hydrolase, partial [Variovorax sp.]|nr:serine hydrolase [Variovorax sp.]
MPPPGDVLEHNTSGYAKAMCSAVFITGLDPAVAAETIGYFTGPYEQRKKVGAPVVDRAKKEVRITMPNGGPTLVARHFGSQGCITLPPGKDDVFFTPVNVKSALADPATVPWPMGDVLPNDPPPADVDMAKVTQAIGAAFETTEAYTAAFVVTHKGRLIGERYMNGMTERSAHLSQSVAKSFTGALVGIMAGRGLLDPQR